jgi:ATP synthase F1 delta subunit
MRKDKESTSSSLTVRVSSAVPLTEEEETALREKLKARFSEDLNFRFEVDSSFLGGVVVWVGEKVIDGSVKGKLEALKQTLALRR